MRHFIFASALFFASLIEGNAQAQTIRTAVAKLHNSEGTEVGIVTLRETQSRGIWLNVSFDQLPPGAHAFHIHETGKCEGDFNSAGGHYAPEQHSHGVLAKDGPHAGDLPNIHVPSDGTLNQEIFLQNVSLAKEGKNTLLDADGSAFVVHQRLDDYKSQPSGDAGARIACGVVTMKLADDADKYQN